MILWHLCLSVRGGVLGVVNFSLTTPPPPHPQNLSHIYDTLTFMFECQGGVVEGGYFSFNLPHHPNPKI